MTDDAISARYDWNPDEMAEALACHQKQSIRPFIRVLLAGLAFIYFFPTVVVPILMLASDSTRPEVKRGAAIALAVALPCWGLAYRGIRRKTFLRWRARRAFGKVPGARTPVEWTFRADHLSSRTLLSASTLLWPAFIKIVETPRGFLFYQGPQLFNWIPCAGFTSAAELGRFVELARSRVTKYVVLKEARYAGKPEPTGLDEL